jgi:hypothetical protein
MCVSEIWYPYLEVAPIYFSVWGGGICTHSIRCHPLLLKKVQEDVNWIYRACPNTKRLPLSTWGNLRINPKYLGYVTALVFSEAHINLEITHIPDFMHERYTNTLSRQTFIFTHITFSLNCLAVRPRWCVDHCLSVRQFPRVKHKEKYRLTFAHVLYLAWNVDRWLIPIKTAINLQGVHKPLVNSASQP